MQKNNKVLVLSSKALKLSIEDLKESTNVPVEWHITDLSDKESIRKLLPEFNVLVSTSLDISWKNEAKNLKAIFMPGAGWDKISPEAVKEETADLRSRGRVKKLELTSLAPSDVTETTVIDVPPDVTVSDTLL